MVFDASPATAAWQHQDVRSGFEVVYFHPLDDGWRIEGCTTAIENRETWTVDYTIDVITLGRHGTPAFPGGQPPGRDRPS